jgi:hypothetical protein
MAETGIKIEYDEGIPVQRIGRKIIVEFEHSLPKEKILFPYVKSTNRGDELDFTDTDLTDKDQTRIYGIQVPLIKINNTTIDFDSVKYFVLKSEGRLPELTLTVEDTYSLISNIDKPGNDNLVIVQIVPKRDNTYKKINLSFYISNIRVSGTLVTLTCKYKLSDLTSSRFETFGEIDTYNMLKNIAIKTKMGFATNLKGETKDKRYVYCNNKSYFDIMNEEIQYSDIDGCLLDYWIDFWDNITLADIKERLKTIEPDEEIEIWVESQVYENTGSVETQPNKVPAVLLNLPQFNQSELFVKDYNMKTTPGAQLSKGSDKVHAIYEENKSDYSDYLLQDKDVKKDIFVKYDYIGELYGDYNYFLSKSVREAYIQKITSDEIIITLNSPNLGLMRGNKVNFLRYVNDSVLENKMKDLEEHKIIDREKVRTNIPLEDYKLWEDSGEGKYRLDKTVSAQYLIYAVEIKYSNNQWQYDLTLVRDIKDKLDAQILMEEDE